MTAGIEEIQLQVLVWIWIMKSLSSNKRWASREVNLYSPRSEHRLGFASCQIPLVIILSFLHFTALVCIDLYVLSCLISIAYICIFNLWLFFLLFSTLLCGWFVSWPLCFADEGRSAVDLAGGAQIVAEHIKSLYQNTEPENEKLLTVFCGMLMNYSNDNGNDHLPPKNNC